MINLMVQGEDNPVLLMDSLRVATIYTQSPMYGSTLKFLQLSSYFHLELQV